MAGLLDLFQNPANTQMLLGTAAGLLGTQGNTRQQLAGGLLGGLQGAQIGAQLQQARAAEEYRRYQLEALRRQEAKEQQTEQAYRGLFGGMPGTSFGDRPTPENAQAMQQQGPLAGLNPALRQFAAQVPASVGFPLIANALTPKAVEPKVVGNALVDPSTGKPIYEAPKDWQDPAYQKWMLDKAAAGRSQTTINNSLSGEKKGSEVMYKNAAEAYSNAQTAARDADKREVYYTGLGNAMQGFRPGATAELRLKLGGIAKDLGIDVAGIPEGQEFQAISSGLELAFAPKGQGAITENEREIIRRGIPNIAQTPEGVMRVIAAGRRLDEHDRKVAKIYRDNARKNGGTINPVEVDEELSKLGPALSQGELNFFEGTKAPQGTPQAAPKQGGAAGTTGNGIKWQVE